MIFSFLLISLSRRNIFIDLKTFFYAHSLYLYFWGFRKCIVISFVKLKDEQFCGSENNLHKLLCKLLLHAVEISMCVTLQTLQRHEILIKCLVSVGSTSYMVAQHWSNIGFLLCGLPGLIAWFEWRCVPNRVSKHSLSLFKYEHYIFHI